MKRRSGLGRGLDALLPVDREELRSSDAGGGLVEVEVASLAPNPKQPRLSFDDDALGELAASIAQLGVLQPLLVRRNHEGGLELIAGERRLRAARRAGLERVPVLVVETDEGGSLERALVENVHREGLNPIEEAAAYRQLLEEGGLTQDSLGHRLGRNRATIANSLRLLDLPTEVQRLVVQGRLTAGHGRALLALGDSPFRERLARRVGDEGISVRETEDLVRRYKEMSSASQTASGGQGRTRSPQVVEAQRLLSEHLQTRVRVDSGTKRGRVTISFSSPDELERLVEVITGEAALEAVRVAPE